MNEWNEIGSSCNLQKKRKKNCHTICRNVISDVEDKKQKCSNLKTNFITWTYGPSSSSIISLRYKNPYGHTHTHTYGGTCQLSVLLKEIQQQQQKKKFTYFYL